MRYMPVGILFLFVDHVLFQQHQMLVVMMTMMMITMETLVMLIRISLVSWLQKKATVVY